MALVVFAGTIGRSVIGGLSWDNMQYLVGLAELGHDVYYLEDCGEESWVYDWDAQQLTNDLAYPTSYLQDCLEPVGLADRWIYRAGANSTGIEIAEFDAICAEADLLIAWGDALTTWRAAYDSPRRRAFIDVDPGFTQISLAQGQHGLHKAVDNCESVFTISPRIGTPTSPLPTYGRQWHHLWPPVALTEWPYVPDAPSQGLACIMNWRGFHDVEYEGAFYGQKDAEFEKFADLPRRITREIQMVQIGADAEELQRAGWRVRSGEELTRTPSKYRELIQSCWGEFGIAKHGYAAMQQAWLSDRSTCFLASGRPAIVQDTGVGAELHAEGGLLTFRTAVDAARCIAEVQSDYAAHSRAARDLAERTFAATEVLPRVLEIAAR